VREKAKVSSIEGSLVRVMVGIDCEGTCAQCMKTDKGRTFMASNSGSLDLSAGDEVEVFVAPLRAIGEGLLIFILPLALFGAGYAIASAVFSADDTIGFISGFAGIGAGFLFNYLRGRYSKGKNLPQIVKKY
jgi:positive regulator of sigma E activity